MLSLNKFVDLVRKFEPVPGKPLEAQMWMDEVEKTFAALDIPENKKVEHASFLLTGRANNWWLSTERHMSNIINLVDVPAGLLQRVFP